MDPDNPRPDAENAIIKSDQASFADRLIVATTLLLASLSATIPALFLIWFVAAVFSVTLTAEALEHTGGLEPTTFGGGYWLGIGVDVAVVAWALVRRLRRHSAPWLPLGWLVIIYIILVWAAVVPDIYAVVDVPDVLTTSALVGLNTLVSYILPLVLLVLATRATRLAWHSGRQSSLASQRVGVLSGCLGLVSVTFAAGLAMIDVDGGALKAASDEFAESIDIDGVEGERRMYAALSLGLGRDVNDPHARTELGGAFYTCADTLAVSNEKPRSILERAIRLILRAGLDKADAEDLVMQTMLKVCLKHAQERRRDIEQYFWRALNNATKDFHRRAYRSGEFDDVFADEALLTASDQLALQQDLSSLRKALATLSPSDQNVLGLYADSVPHARIAKRLGKSEAAARQQVKRALDRLKRAYRRQIER